MTEAWRTVLQMTGHRCVYCGAFGKMTRDHVQPKALCGPDTAANLLPACEVCNLDKGDQPWRWWLAASGRRERIPLVEGLLRQLKAHFGGDCPALATMTAARRRRLHRRYRRSQLRMDKRVDLVGDVPEGLDPALWRAYLERAGTGCCFCELRTEGLTHRQLGHRGHLYFLPLCGPCAFAVGSDEKLSAMLQVTTSGPIERLASALALQDELGISRLPNEGRQTG